MAGNRYKFEEAMQKANELVWSEKWTDAAKTYRRALSEFPNNVSALMGYAWSLFNANALDEAFKVYQRLTEVAPDDPGPHERVGEILEKRGEHEKAAAMYAAAAERYLEQGITNKLVPSLEATVRNDPYNAQVWGELIKHYQQGRNIENTVLAAHWLAHLYQGEHDEWAIEVCRQMQNFLPGDQRIVNLMKLLQSGRPIPEPPPIGARVPMPEESSEDGGEAEGIGEGTPTEMAQQRALEHLAEAIFSEDKPQPYGISEMEAALLISKAVDAQTRGDLSVAQDAYEQLIEAQISMPSIHFNLGLIYKEQMHFDEAIAQFEQSLAAPEYVLGSNHALGECYQAQGKFETALKYFLEGLKIVDLNTVQRDQANDLIRVYESLAQNLVSTGEPERIQQLSRALTEFMGQRGWEEESRKARKRLDSLARTGTVLSLAELISLPGADDILPSVTMAQEYMRRKNPYRALEELLHTIGKAPYYLPLHHLLGTFLLENGNLEAAAEKFSTIANTYETRQQVAQALATYVQILELHPLDIPIHKRVIELFIQRGQIDRALDQYLQLADAYYQLAQPEQARDAYAEAIKLAPRGTADNRWEVRILHRMADLDMQRLDWHAAIKDYEEIIRIAPNDERAALGLLRLYPRTGRPHLGINALDKLLKHYLQARKAQKAIAVLEQLIQEEPDSIPLRMRIAQLSLNLGQKDKALEHLDILGDLQLEAGQKEAAIKTIEAILALKPPDASAYNILYKEMTGREPPST